MFDAARAALLSVHAPVPTEVAQTHSDLNAALSLQVVKPGLVAVAHGRALNKVEDLRLIADYRDAPVTVENATWALEQSSNFLLAVQTATKPS